MARTLMFALACIGMLCIAVAAEDAHVLTEVEIDTMATDVPLPASDFNHDRGAHKVGDNSEETIMWVHKYRQAVKLMEEYQFQAAIKLLREYIAHFGPNAYTAHRQIARACWLDGKLTEAAFWFGRLLQIVETGQSRPQKRVGFGLWAEYLTDVSQNWSILGKDRLRALFEERSDQFELYPLHESALGLVDAEQEDVVDLADAFFEKAVGYLDIADKYHYQQWALSMASMGRYKKAVQVARSALDAPSNPSKPAYDEDTYKMLADFNKRQRKFEKCIKFGNSALGLGSVDVIFVMADCYLGLHKPEAAMRLLQDTAEEYRFLEEELLYQAYVAQVLGFQGKNEEAKAVYQHALELADDVHLQGTIYIALANLEDSMGLLEDAHSNYEIGTDLLYDQWIYSNYKPRWKVADKHCPRKQVHHNRVTDYNLIQSRDIIMAGSDFFGKEGATPLAAPGLAEKAGWKQKQELYFEEPSVHHTVVPLSAVFGESTLNIQQCGLLTGYPASFDEANGLNKLVTRVEKGIFLGPGGSFDDLSWLLLHKFPQLMLLKEARVFKESPAIIAPDAPLVLELLELLGVQENLVKFEPKITSVFAETMEMIEIFKESDSDSPVEPFENAQFVSKWALKKARKLLLPESDPLEGKGKIVVIKSVPKYELDLTIARQVDLHQALEELGEVVVFNPFSTTLSLAKLRAVFQSASVVVGPHSHGLAGMLFAAPGTPVVELPVQGGNHNLYANLATALDLPYWIVPTCQSPRVGEYDLSDTNIQEIVATVRLALAGEGGEHVPLYRPAANHHDEL